MLIGVIVITPIPAYSAENTPFQARVYATREGLVGKTTANGHVIVARDHFVALPSRRGLSQKDGGERTVRVCTDAGRCEYAPVWDVGPWNTRDDYWNADREQWRDLPRGMPEAQAAFSHSYNGGKDQFGRTVRNPASIDLADGTFWDGLKLTDNAWVTVTYLWTGSAPGSGQVATLSGPLNVRSGPGTAHPVAGLAARHAILPVECWVDGERIGSTTRWYRLPGGQYVTRAYLVDKVAPPRC